MPMKFYDLEWLAQKCGTDNKYEITVKVAAEARRESEEASFLKDKSAVNERFISNVLLEIEEGRSPIGVDYDPSKVAPVPEPQPMPKPVIAPKDEEVIPDPDEDEPDQELEDELETDSDE